jgi:hypothetical protein
MSTRHLHCCDVVPDEERREAIGHMGKHINYFVRAHLDCEAGELHWQQQVSIRTC